MVDWHMLQLVAIGLLRLTCNTMRPAEQTVSKYVSRQTPEIGV